MVVPYGGNHHARRVALIGTPSNWNEVAEALVVGFLY